MAIVYRHIRNDNGDTFYVGMGRDLERAYWKYGRCDAWKDIVKNVGYKIDILYKDISWEDALLKEEEYIKLYGRIDLGNGTLVNRTDGFGFKGRKHTLESRLKMGKCGRIPWNKGLELGPSWNAGLKLSDNHRNNLKGPRPNAKIWNRRIDKTEVIKLFEDGFSKKDISIKIEANYSYICKIIKNNYK